MMLAGSLSKTSDRLDRLPRRRESVESWFASGPPLCRSNSWTSGLLAPLAYASGVRPSESTALALALFCEVGKTGEGSKVSGGVAQSNSYYENTFYLHSSALAVMEAALNLS